MTYTHFSHSQSWLSLESLASFLEGASLGTPETIGRTPSGICWYWPGICSPPGNATLNLLAAGLGIFLAVFAIWLERKHKAEEDATMGALSMATGELTKTANQIADRLAHKITNVGEAMAYAYKMINEAREVSKKNGVGTTIEVYYINIVVCFGLAHACNDDVITKFIAKLDNISQAGGVKPTSYDGFLAEFPDMLQNLAEETNTKILILDEPFLDTKFFDVLNAHPKYQSDEATKCLGKARKKEEAERSSFNATAVARADGIPFQMITSRVLDSDGATRAASSLVFAVGTQSLESVLDAEQKAIQRDSTYAFGYFTEDSHYAEIDVKVASAMWDAAQSRFAAA